MADKILYFNLRARAEPTRIVYALAGKPLVDERTTLEKWETLKADQPLGQLPVFTCSEGTLVMSNTIARYAAKKFGMMGGNLWEEALNDMIVEACQESFEKLSSKVLRWKVMNIDPEPENPNVVIEEAYQELLKTLDFIKKVAEKRAKAFLICDEISLADIVVFVALQHAAVVYPEVMSENEWIEEFVNKMTSDERLKKYLEEREETPL